ncbi:MAG: thymidine phosphorylase [Candidatus Pacearchaeota archaeon]
MFVKARALNLLTGKPVAIIPSEISKWLNVHVGDRIIIKKYGEQKEIIAVIDITKTEEKADYIFISNEIIDFLKIKENDLLEINVAQRPISTVYIKEKLDGRKLDYKKLFEIMRSIVHNELTEAEIAYFVSASYIRGMDINEITDLTRAMVDVGNKIRFDKKFVIDKHCIGGIPGNRTTPIVVSMIAAAIKELKLDAVMPKTSSRAITSASGTADVIELLARVEFNISEIKQIVNKAKACLVWGGSLGVSPADDKIIQVERFLNLDPKSQLIASIMSKKISVGSNVILIDIPFGEGAKVKTKSEAFILKKYFEAMGRKFKMKLKTVLTEGNQPIGNGIGPVLELRDVMAVIKNRPTKPEDLANKSVFLAKQILGMVINKEKAEKIVEKLIKNGKVYEAFKTIIKAQGGEIDEKRLEPSNIFNEIKSEKNGKIASIDNKKINFIARLLGCPADKLAGLYLKKHLNDAVEKGETYAILYAETKEKLDYATKIFNEIKPIIIK